MANIEERSFDFAVRIVKLKDYLYEHKKEYESNSIFNECVEIEKILYAIVRTTKNNLQK